MQLARFGEVGEEKPGIFIAADGTLRDAGEAVGDWRGDTLGDDALDNIRRINAADLPVVGDAKTRLGAPVAGVGKIVGIGLNYRAHAAEAGVAPPAEPIIFLKSPTAINGPHDDIVLPRGAAKADWEVELAAVIGKGGKNIAEADALSHIAGYCVGLDISERAFQLERGGQWTKGKSADTFAPIGPHLVTRDEIAAPGALDLSLDINGEPKQRGNTADMIFPLARLIACVSEYMTWKPGDILFTGTPPGVGMAQTPPRYLRPGDKIRARIDGLGELQCKIAG
jgi:2-keto-4-pentenoate hydratase/2-oxohepta-3-ene-1,7-dioic acid hydratase in catechol pathway